MKGTVKAIDDKLQLVLVPENRQEKTWLVNAFYCISPGVLLSNEGNVESLVLWTDNNYKLPRKRASVAKDKTNGEKQERRAVQVVHMFH